MSKYLHKFVVVCERWTIDGDRRDNIECIYDTKEDAESYLAILSHPAIDANKTFIRGWVRTVPYMIAREHLVENKPESVEA